MEASDFTEPSVFSCPEGKHLLSMSSLPFNEWAGEPGASVQKTEENTVLLPLEIPSCEFLGVCLFCNTSGYLDGATKWQIEERCHSEDTVSSHCHICKEDC